MKFFLNTRRVLYSESGAFVVDGNGIVQSFEPSEGNPLFDEKTELNENYIYCTQRSIRTFVVPDGVKGFVSGFMLGVRVTERFELPEGLINIGNNLYDIKEGVHDVFADCILPTVVIPQSVKEIGIFAFGHTHIESLQLPASLYSPYGRQFKDSYIGTLRLPQEWKGIVSLDEHNGLDVTDSLDANTYGYLRWPSTYVERLEFY